MKRRILYLGAALALVLALTLPMALPVGAETTTSSLIQYLSVTPGQAQPDGTLYYTVTLENLDITSAKPADVIINFYPPTPSGAASAVAIELDSRVIAVGEKVVYTWPGGGGDEERAALAVNLGALPLDAGVTVVRAASEFDGQYVHTPPYEAYDYRDIPATIIRPNTRVTIDASKTAVVPGEAVTLILTEKNTGDVDLRDVRVEVLKNGAPFATLDHNTAGWSSDLDLDDVLDVGETWTWSITSGPIDATTKFVALGFGIDPAGNEISYATGFADERDEVTISTDHSVGGEGFAGNKAAILARWIALAGLVVGGVAMLRRRSAAEMG